MTFFHEKGLYDTPYYVSCNFSGAHVLHSLTNIENDSNRFVKDHVSCLAVESLNWSDHFTWLNKDRFGTHIIHVHTVICDTDCDKEPARQAIYISRVATRIIQYHSVSYRYLEYPCARAVDNATSLTVYINSKQQHVT